MKLSGIQAPPLFLSRSGSPNSPKWLLEPRPSHPYSKQERRQGKRGPLPTWVSFLSGTFLQVLSTLLPTSRWLKPGNVAMFICKGLGSVDAQLDSLPPKITGILLLRKGKWATESKWSLPQQVTLKKDTVTVLTFWELWSFIYYLIFHGLWSREVNIKLEDVAAF